MDGNVHIVHTVAHIARSLISVAIYNFSNLVKTGWGVKNWPCVQPKHCKQQDGYNCGVYVCFVSKTPCMSNAFCTYSSLTELLIIFSVARCLIQDLQLTSNVNIVTERRRVLSTLFGSCYDDIAK